MPERSMTFDIVIVGAGPAGLAAAVTASQSSQSVAVIESNPWVGGQLWRRPESPTTPMTGKKWLNWAIAIGVLVLIAIVALITIEVIGV